MNPGDWESYFYRARLYYMNNRYADALKDLDKVLSPLPNYFDALLLTAKCHLNQRNPFEAQKWLSRAMSINPGHTEIRDLWVTINKKITAKLYWRIFLKPLEIRKSVQLLTEHLRAIGRPITLTGILQRMMNWGKIILCGLFILALCFMNVFMGVGVIIYLIIKFSSDNENTQSG